MAQQFNLPPGRGPVLQNQPVPNVDFAPKPIANPIDAAMQGLEQGQSLGLRSQQMRILRDQQEAARQKAEQDKADKSIAYLTDSKFSKFLSKETKLKLFKDNVVPVLNSKYGLNIDPSNIEHGDGEDGDVERLLNLVKNGAAKEIIQHEYQQAVLKSQPEQLPMLKEFGDTLGFGDHSGTQDRFNENMSYKKEQDWAKLSDKVNALGASSRKAIGVAATANMRADRLNTLANDPNATPEDIRREVIDLEGIMTGGVPHEMSIKYGDISNINTKLAKLREAITSKPQAANLPEWQNRLKEVANGLRQVDNKIIHDNLGINAVGYRGLINEDRGRWNDLVSAVNQSVTPSSGSATGVPMVTFTDSEGDTHTIPAANLPAAQKRDPGLRVQ